jgi:hypothetical protein
MRPIRCHYPLTRDSFFTFILKIPQAKSDKWSTHDAVSISDYTVCFKRNMPYLGRKPLRFTYMDITQKIPASESESLQKNCRNKKCCLLEVLFTLLFEDILYPYITQVHSLADSEARPSGGERAMLCT